MGRATRPSQIFVEGLPVPVLVGLLTSFVLSAHSDEVLIGTTDTPPVGLLPFGKVGRILPPPSK